MATTEEIKALRDETGVSIMQCKKALEEAGGDKEKALILLRRKGSEIAAKKGSRNLGSGVVAAYIHANGSVGAMVELQCETDFVAKNEDFKKMAYEIAMQIAATSPEFIRAEDIGEEDKAKAKEVLEEEVKDKPEDMKAKILEGKLQSYFEDKVLMDQKYIKDPNLSIRDLVQNGVQKFGENMDIGRFERYKVNEA